MPTLGQRRNASWDVKSMLVIKRFLTGLLFGWLLYWAKHFNLINYLGLCVFRKTISCIFISLLSNKLQTTWYIWRQWHVSGEDGKSWGTAYIGLHGCDFFICQIWDALQGRGSECKIQISICPPTCEHVRKYISYSMIMKMTVKGINHNKVQPAYKMLIIYKIHMKDTLQLAVFCLIYIPHWSVFAKCNNKPNYKEDPLYTVINKLW